MNVRTQVLGCDLGLSLEFGTCFPTPSILPLMYRSSRGVGECSQDCHGVVAIPLASPDRLMISSPPDWPRAVSSTPPGRVRWGDRCAKCQHRPHAWTVSEIRLVISTSPRPHHSHQRRPGDREKETDRVRLGAPIVHRIVRALLQEQDTWRVRQSGRGRVDAKAEVHSSGRLRVTVHSALPPATFQSSVRPDALLPSGHECALLQGSRDRWVPKFSKWLGVLQQRIAKSSEFDVYALMETRFT